MATVTITIRINDDGSIAVERDAVEHADDDTVMAIIGKWIDDNFDGDAKQALRGIEEHGGSVTITSSLSAIH